MAWMGPWVCRKAAPMAVVGQPTLLGAQPPPPGPRQDESEDDGQPTTPTTSRRRRRQQQAAVARPRRSVQSVGAQRRSLNIQRPPKGPHPIAKVRRPQSIRGVPISAPPLRGAKPCGCIVKSRVVRSNRPNEEGGGCSRLAAETPPPPARAPTRGARGSEAKNRPGHFATRRCVGGVGAPYAVDFEGVVLTRASQSQARLRPGRLKMEARPHRSLPLGLECGERECQQSTWG